jgi:hypothetical protein
MDGFFDWSATSHITDEMMRCFENSIGIELSKEAPVQHPNLCYIESEEVRDEYRTTFTQSDILNYIYAMQHSSSQTKSEMVLPGVNGTIPYPKNSITFWKLAKLGKELRQAGAKDSRRAMELIKAIARIR